MVMNNRMTERFAKMRLHAGKKEIMCISSLFDGFEEALVYLLQDEAWRKEVGIE